MGIQPGNNNFYSGLARTFINQINQCATLVSCPKGGVLFRQGDPPSHFFTLLKGQVALCIGKRDTVIYKVGDGGEAFGWSSLIGSGAYTASAVCVADVKALKYDGNRLKTLLTGKSTKTLRFYQNLSCVMDKRLRQNSGLLAFLTDRPKRSIDKESQTQDHFDLLS